MTALFPAVSTLIVNDSGMPIPPRSVVVAVSVETTTATENNESITLTHVKQYATGLAGNVMVTGQVTIDTGKRGLAYFDQFIYVAVDPTIADPIAGEEWGPKSGSWTISKGGLGFISQGHSDNGGVPKRSLFFRSPKSSSGSGVTTIRFLVISSDPTTLTVLGEVKAWDAGYTLYDVPGDLNAAFGLGPPLGVVEVCDPSGCYFDEPYDMLFGRMGWAKYTSSLTADSCRTGYPPFPPKWEVFSLCCAKPLCSFGGA